MNKLQKKIMNILPAIRMLLSEKEPINCKLIPRNKIPSENMKKYSSRMINFLRLTGDTEEEITDQIKRNGIHQKGYLFLEKHGLICCAETKAAVDVMFSNAMRIFNNEQIEHIPVYQPTGRVKNKIIIITGAAQGFGKGIAMDLFEEGANVIIADLNKQAGKELENELNSRNRFNRALFLKTDVSDPVSVADLVANTVTEFGGLDVMISNAGVLHAGGLDEMDPSTFEFMTKVNYSGYFYCAKYASAVMKAQNKYAKEHFSDIIQINSKSGLKGSKKNFAYAGGKFGGIGLTQSFALELMSEKIKVNSICPGNFFDGPLWSDPEKGLFVQYLKAGKVPGAKTIQEVKAFYEAQVPAGRGCEVKDITRAILYAIEQEYETGQAIPVTGGQNMLN